MSQLLDALAGVPNACEPRPGLVTGGQPEVRHLEALRRAGARAVVDMRDPMEPRPYDVPDAVRAAGLEYVSIPVDHAPRDARPLDALRRALRGRDSKAGVLCHCSSGNRTAAALIPYLVLDCGMSEDDATMEAMKMGCRDAGLVEWALDYVRKESSRRV